MKSKDLITHRALLGMILMAREQDAELTLVLVSSFGEHELDFESDDVAAVLERKPEALALVTQEVTGIFPSGRSQITIKIEEVEGR